MNISINLYTLMLLALISFATFVTISHALTLFWMQRNQAISIKTRKRAWRLHILINGNLWRLLFLWVIAVQLYFFKGISFAWMPFSILLIGAGLWLAISAHVKLGGFEGGMGKIFFFPNNSKGWIKDGLYRYLGNPIYDGFVLILIGLGILLGAIENYYLALTSFILLNGILAFIESRGYRYRII